mgnify:CR=1 FL=1
MIPEAGHIARAAGLDETIMRELDLSCHILDNNGGSAWAGAGRWTALAQELEDVKKGFFVFKSTQGEGEWEVTLALTETFVGLESASKEIGLDIYPQYSDSLKFLMYGTTDDLEIDERRELYQRILDGEE